MEEREDCGFGLAGAGGGYEECVFVIEDVGDRAYLWLGWFHEPLLYQSRTYSWMEMAKDIVEYRSFRIYCIPHNVICCSFDHLVPFSSFFALFQTVLSFL